MHLSVVQAHFLKSRVLFSVQVLSSSDLYDFTSDFLPPSLIPHLVPQRAGTDLNKLTNHMLKVNKQVLCLEVRLSGSRLVIRNACNAWSAWQPLTVERGPGAEWALGRTALYSQDWTPLFLGIPAFALNCYGVVFTSSSLTLKKKWLFIAMWQVH